jgi:Ferritin-like domain
MSQHTPAVDVSHLAAYDTDGALTEAATNLNAVQSRRGFLRGAGIAAGGVAFGGALLPTAAFAFSAKEDRAILNYALTLEYLEAAFYGSALKHAGLTGEHHRFATTVHAHEVAHVKALKTALGSKAVKRPTFDFGSAVRSQSAFSKTSIVLEDTGVQAYQGQAPNIKSSKLLAAALSIHPIEARHASWIRNISGQIPAPDAFNPALSKGAVLAAVAATGFIK